MGRKLIDLTGKRFGMLTAIKRADDINGDPAWYCILLVVVATCVGPALRLVDAKE